MFGPLKAPPSSGENLESTRSPVDCTGSAQVPVGWSPILEGSLDSKDLGYLMGKALSDLTTALKFQLTSKELEFSQ